ncbi:MAG: hypothetical protein AVDCRST_MAG19-3576, partial [uncultured Thermomicrobiales bacterium]
WHRRLRSVGAASSPAIPPAGRWRPPWAAVTQGEGENNRVIPGGVGPAAPSGVGLAVGTRPRRSAGGHRTCIPLPRWRPAAPSSDPFATVTARTPHGT